jgi:uncharacterized protein YkwD
LSEELSGLSDTAYRREAGGGKPLPYGTQGRADGWMGSPVHQEHLLSSVPNEVGFGLAFGKIPGGYEIIWVQNFGRLKRVSPRSKL